MARSRSKKAAETAPKTKETAGFYKKNSAGNALNFAPTAVHFPGGASLEIAKFAEYTYPVNGWSYYESIETAYAAEGLPLPEPKANPTRANIAEAIAARKAMTREEKEAERAQRNAARLAKVEEKHPERASQLRNSMAKREALAAQREALRAMSPEQRKEARLAELQKKNPALAAKLKANEDARASKMTARSTN